MMAFQKLCTFLDFSAVVVDKFPTEHGKHEKAGQAVEGVLCWGGLELGKSTERYIVCGWGGGARSSLHCRVAASF